MKKVILLTLFVIPIALCLTGCRGTVPVSEEISAEIITGTHPSTFVSAQDLQSYRAEQNKEELVQGKIVAGVTPHHLVAGKLIADFFSTLAAQNPPTLILVGPNHSNRGGKAITGLYAWQTPEGLAPTDQAIVRELVNAGLAVLDEETLAQEHSIGTLVPFAYHYLPESKIVPLVLHHDVSLQEVDNLLQGLQPFLEKGAVLVASVDFSHYLKRREAEAKDMTTLRLMKEFDYTALNRLDSNYLDSPASLFMALRAGELFGIKGFTVLKHSNSGLILQNDTIETTSYFTLAITKKESL